MVILYRATGGIYNGTKLNPFEGTYTTAAAGVICAIRGSMCTRPR